MLKLVICEKPSQAESYAVILGANERHGGFFAGNGYIVAYCYGHLLELASPEAYGEKYAKWRYEDLPVVPEKWIHTPLKNKAAQLEILKELLNRADVECVINACDAGREGELIFRLVYEYAKCIKPLKRLWLRSVEDIAVKAGFMALKDGSEYDSLHTAASCRERADWLVGMNSTRLFSVHYGTTLNTGRVQSPTLALIVKREKDIDTFIKEPHYTPVLDLGCFKASSETHKDLKTAEAIVAACSGKCAIVSAIEYQQKKALPPKLYDLTSLQRDANRLLGYTAQQTLEYIQSLYEKKITSYPRTDARYITKDMQATVLEILGDTDFIPDLDRITGKVSDHHAIITTPVSIYAEISLLPSGEREIFDLVRKRLIAAVSPEHVYETVIVTLSCGGSTFTAKGKKVITPGWKVQPDEDEDGEENADLPELSKGQTFESIKVTVKVGATTPPKHYTEDTLLLAMETAGKEDMPEDAQRKGLGTPATRAAIIEKLIKTGFAVRTRKNLLPTDKGKTLIAVLPAALTSANMTAMWEHKLKQVERGELGGDAFMEDITQFIKSIVSDNAAPKQEFISLFPGSKRAAAEPLGMCPRCGSTVREGVKGFFCDSRTCGFKIWRENRFWTAKRKPLTAAVITALLKDGRIAAKDLYSEKTGKKYEAVIVLDDPGDGFVNFKLEFSGGEYRGL